MVCVIPARGRTDTGHDVTVGACAFILFSFRRHCSANRFLKALGSFMLVFARTRAYSTDVQASITVRPLYIAGTGNLSVSLFFPCIIVLFPSDLRRCRRPACIASVPRRDDLLLRFGVGLRPARISPLALLLMYPGSRTGAALGTPVVTGITPALCANPGRRRPG